MNRIHYGRAYWKDSITRGVNLLRQGRDGMPLGAGWAYVVVGIYLCGSMCALSDPWVYTKEGFKLEAMIGRTVDPTVKVCAAPGSRPRSEGKPRQDMERGDSLGNSCTDRCSMCIADSDTFKRSNRSIDLAVYGWREGDSVVGIPHNTWSTIWRGRHSKSQWGHVQNHLECCLESWHTPEGEELHEETTIKLIVGHAKFTSMMNERDDKLSDIRIGGR